MRKTTPFAAARALLASAVVTAVALVLGITLDMASGSSTTLAVRGLEEPPEYVSLGIRYGGFSGYPYVLSSDADDGEVAAAKFRESLREFNETLREANETLREANELLGKPKASRAHETTAAAEEARARADGSTPYDPRLSAAATRSGVLAAVGWGLATMLLWGLLVARRCWSRRGVLESYITEMQPELVRLHGRTDEYQLVHVTQALEASRVSRRYEEAAFAFFCKEAAFRADPRLRERDYAGLRNEILALQRRVVSREWGGGRVEYAGYEPP